MASRFDTIPQFNPYIQQFPTELMEQVGLSKQQGYNQGVQVVQSYIDKVSGLDVMKDADKSYINSKVGEIGDQVKKLAGQDFSNPLIQNKVGQLAGGVYNDKGIQNAVLGTQAVRQKQSYINEIKTKKPELYNPNNEAYAMLDINSWLNDGQAGSKLNDGRSYYDYYDYAKEVRDAMKDFKPSHLLSKTPNGEWLVTNEDKSYTNSEIKKYLEATLSDRAKQQMRVESTVDFHGNDQSLLSSYMQDLDSTRTSSRQQMLELQAKSTVTKDQSERAALRSQINQLNDTALEADNRLSDINSGNLNFFNAHKENIGASLFTNAYLSQQAQGYSHPDITVEYNPNSVWQTKFTQSMENGRFNARLQFDAGQNALNRADKEKDRQQAMDLKQVELGLKYFDKDGRLKRNTEGDLLPSQPRIDETSVTTTGKSQFDKAYKDLDAASGENYNLLKQKLLANNTDLRQQYLKFVAQGGVENSANDPSSLAAKELLRQERAKPTAQRSQWINDYNQRENTIMTQRSIYNNNKQDIEDQVSLQYGKPIADLQKAYSIIPSAKINFSQQLPKSEWKPGQPIVQSSQETVPVDKMRSIILQGNKANSENYYKSAGSYSNPSKKFDDFIWYDPAEGTYTIGINNKTTSMSYGRLPESIKQTIQLSQSNTNLQTGAEKLRNNLYNQSVANLGDWRTPTSNKDPRVINSINYLSNQIGADKGEVNIAYVNTSTGDVQFKIKPKKNASGVTSNINPAILEGYGYTHDKLNDTYTVKGLPYFKRDESNLSPTEDILAKSLDREINISKPTYYTPAHTYDPNSNGQFVQIVKDLDPKTNQFRYYLKHENSGEILDFQQFTDPISAISAAKELTKDKKVLQDIIRKKNPTYNIDTAE